MEAVFCVYELQNLLSRFVVPVGDFEVGTLFAEEAFQVFGQTAAGDVGDTVKGDAGIESRTDGGIVADMGLEQSFADSFTEFFDIYYYMKGRLFFIR